MFSSIVVPVDLSEIDIAQNALDRAVALAAMTNAEAQYGAYSQNGGSGPLRRYAQEEYPKKRMHLEYAKRIAGGL